MDMTTREDAELARLEQMHFCDVMRELEQKIEDDEKEQRSMSDDMTDAERYTQDDRGCEMDVLSGTDIVQFVGIQGAVVTHGDQATVFRLEWPDGSAIVMGNDGNYDLGIHRDKLADAEAIVDAERIEDTNAEEAWSRWLNDDDLFTTAWGYA